MAMVVSPTAPSMIDSAAPLIVRVVSPWTELEP